MSVSRTVVISCAGMGDRLGFGKTKALVEIDGKSLIARHLEMLGEEHDIRVVVGYQANQVMEAVRKQRSDVTFVLNHDYRTTGTGASVALAVNDRQAGEYVLSLDGDLLVHPNDMEKILQCGHEFAGGQAPVTDDPWMLQTFLENGVEYVKAFSKNAGNYEWNGITQMESAKMRSGSGHVFQMLEPHLPVPFMELRTREIDTVNDYERAALWVRNGFI